jgi:hypothetical protein
MKTKVVQQILFMAVTLIIVIACASGFMPYVQADNSTVFGPQPVLGGGGTYVGPLENNSIVEVGGDVYLADKLTLSAPWIALAAALIVGTAVAVRRKKARC